MGCEPFFSSLNVLPDLCAESLLDVCVCVFFHGEPGFF